MKNIRFGSKGLFLAVFLILLYLVTTTTSYLYFTASRMVVGGPISPVPEKEESGYILDPIPTPTDQSAFQVLVLGYGGGGHPGGLLSDAMMVVRIDYQRKAASLVSIPRDIWLTMPWGEGGKTTRKINHAYAIGGGGLAKEAVSTVTGLPVEYFVAVSFEGFKQAIDLLGGVEVEVPVTFDDYYFPIPGRENDPCGHTPEEVEEILDTHSGFEIDKQFPCRFDHLHFDRGKQKMDGETALKFVRSRHSAQHGGDFARLEREQAVILGIFQELLSLGADRRAVFFFNKLSHTIKTDLDEETIVALVDLAGGGSEYDFSRVYISKDLVEPSTTRDGQFVLIPKEGMGEWNEIRAHVQEQVQVK